MPGDREILLIYDAQCPACDMYCRLARIRKSVGELKLVDAREASPVLQEITAAGLDIDQGMVLKIGSEMYYGAEAIHMLSMLSTRSGFFNRLVYWLFRSRRVSRFLYPLLRGCRNLLLKLLRKTRINNLEIADNSRF